MIKTAVWRPYCDRTSRYGTDPITLRSSAYQFIRHGVLHVTQAVQSGYLETAQNDLVCVVDVLLPARRSFTDFNRRKTGLHQLMNPVSTFGDYPLEVFVKLA